MLACMMGFHREGRNAASQQSNMHTASIPHVPNGLPSPTLTNPDMILPDNSSTSDLSLTPQQDKPLPSPPSSKAEYVRSQSGHADQRKAQAIMSRPSRNGLRSRYEGRPRFRSSSEKGDNRITLEQNRLSFHQEEDSPSASPPTPQENSGDLGQRIYTESTQGDYENGEGTYHTPAILEEDENDPYSHAAMTRRAEEILANAKKRLTVSFRGACMSRNLLSNQTPEHGGKLEPCAQHPQYQTVVLDVVLRQSHP